MATKGMTVFTNGGEDYAINDQNIADEFSTGTTYNIGDYCYYQGSLYRFTSAHAAGAWNSGHVTQVKVDTELQDLEYIRQENRQENTFGSKVTGMEWIAGKYIITDGAQAGRYGNNADYSATKRIKLRANAHYKITKQTDTRWCVYDKSNQLIMGSTKSYEFIASDSWDNMIVSTKTADKATFAISVSYDEYIGNAFENAAVKFNQVLAIEGWTAGNYVSAASGNIGTNDDWSMTDKLPAFPGAEFFIDCDEFQGAIYDASMTFISGFISSGNHMVPIPSNGRFIAFSCPTAKKDNNCLKYSLRGYMASGYNAMIKTPSSFNIVEGAYISAFSGATNANANFFYTDYIPVVANEIYEIYPCVGHVAFFNGSFSYVGGNFPSGSSNLNRVFRIPNDAVYMRVSMETEHEAYFTVKRGVDRIEVRQKTSSPGDFYASIDKAFLDARYVNLPIYIYGGEWDVTSLYTTDGIMVTTDVYGIGSPKIVAHPTTYNEEFSLLNMFGVQQNPQVMGRIVIDGLTLEASNMRYCIHDEMGSNTTVGLDKCGYTHIVRNCILIGGTGLKRDVGIGVGDNGFLLYENCIFMNSDPDAEPNQLAMHSGFAGQRTGTIGIVKDCLFINGTCSFDEVGDYTGFTNTFIAQNNSAEAEPYAVYVDHQKNQFYSWNNVIRE